MKEQARRDSNPQHPDLESGALPLELLACKNVLIHDNVLTAPPLLRLSVEGMFTVKFTIFFKF
jgi:hypothetical protein